MFFHAMKENIAMMAYNIVENEEENSINASFHCSAMQQLFRTDRVYSYLHDCKIKNFYFNSLFRVKVMSSNVSNCEYFVFFLIFFI